MNLILRQRLDKLTEQGLYRSLYALPDARAKFEDDGQKILNFSSNDYLDLSHQPFVRQAVLEAITKLGGGAPSSRLMSGHLTIHAKLEETLAKLMETESTLVFGSGFLANLGVITSLVGRKDVVFSDKLCHASLLDGIRLSGATSYRFQHNNMVDLEDLLQKYALPGQLNLIITESVFSMDGDLAPVQKIVELGQKYQAMVMIDEAHALGVFGHQGGGLCSDLPPNCRPDVVMATLGKSLGSYGGFCAVKAELKEFFINTARSFIFSTALPPATIAAAQAAVQEILAHSQMGKELRERTLFFCRELNRLGIKVIESPSSIVPIMIGDNQKALDLAHCLREKGLLVTAIRPPTVPVGTARLRLSVSLVHTLEDLRFAAYLIAEQFLHQKGC